MLLWRTSRQFYHHSAISCSSRSTPVSYLESKMTRGETNSFKLPSTLMPMSCSLGLQQMPSSYKYPTTDLSTPHRSQANSKFDSRGLVSGLSQRASRLKCTTSQQKLYWRTPPASPPSPPLLFTILRMPMMLGWFSRTIFYSLRGFSETFTTVLRAVSWLEVWLGKGYEWWAKVRIGEEGVGKTEGCGFFGETRCVLQGKLLFIVEQIQGIKFASRRSLTLIWVGINKWEFMDFEIQWVWEWNIQVQLLVLSTMSMLNRIYYDDPIINQGAVANELHKISQKLSQLIQSNAHLTKMVSMLLNQNDCVLPPTKTQANQSFSMPYQSSKHSNSAIKGSQQFQRREEIENPRLPQNQLYNYRNHQNDYFDQQFLQRVQEDAFDQSIIMPFQDISERSHLQFSSSNHPQPNPIMDSDTLLRLLSAQFQKMSLKFTQCECLYLYPQMGGQSFIEKIADENNVVLVARLKSKELVGAFSEVGFSSKPSYIPKDNPKCCLFNLTKRRFLYASRTNKTHSYDKNHLIFGNWEIKIKVGEDKLESDLGTRGDCFKKNGFGPNQLEVHNTREWIFGQDSKLKAYELQRYMICALK